MSVVPANRVTRENGANGVAEFRIPEERESQVEAKRSRFGLAVVFSVPRLPALHNLHRSRHFCASESD